MDMEDEILPASSWVRDQLAEIDRTGDTASVGIQGRDIVVYSMRGRKSGALRRVPLMRVEHDGSYAAVASKGGHSEHPEWFHNLVADPEVTVQDGTEHIKGRARIVEGEERAQWWERSVAAFPTYAEYEAKTEGLREIPVFVIDPI